jgi:hypothetical protein
MARASRRTDLTPLVELVSANYPRVARDLINPILELLRLSRLCTGDIESYLIILVIGVRVAEDPRFRGSSVEELLQREELPSRGTNIRSIADSLEMPRETVRRKVAEVIEAGWVVRHGDYLTLSAQIFRDMAHLKRSIEQLAARNYVTVADLLARQAASPVATAAHEAGGPRTRRQG